MTEANVHRCGAGLLILLAANGCGSDPRPEDHSASGRPPTVIGEKIASDATWGNTEGPAIDSKGTLYFCARGKFKGIVAWTEKEGARRHVDLDAVNGPGGLWMDGEDNIYATGPGERKVWKISPDKKISVLAE